MSRITGACKILIALSYTSSTGFIAVSRVGIAIKTRSFLVLANTRPAIARSKSFRDRAANLAFGALVARVANLASFVTTQKITSSFVPEVSILIALIAKWLALLLPDLTSNWLKRFRVCPNSFGHEPPVDGSTTAVDPPFV